MITDEQFIDALHAVTTATPNACAPGSYRMNGAPFCVVGKALAHIDDALCPDNNEYLAYMLLTKRGCSPEVAAAGEVAQGLNDRGLPWQLVRHGFDRALTLVSQGLNRYQVRDRVVSELALNFRIPVAYVPDPVTTGSLEKQLVALNAAFTSLTTVANAMAISMCSVSTSTTATVTVSKKKDHALVA
jgi:hypothetical protein